MFLISIKRNMCKYCLIMLNNGKFVCGLLPILIALLAAIIYFYYPDKFILLSPSAVFCTFDLTGNKMCEFQNVIYNSNTASFHIVLNQESIVHGIKTYKDFQAIQLSSVNSHSNFFANVTVQLEKSLMCKETANFVVAMVRFKPDNLMHVIHDDLLPLFITLERICNGDWTFCLNNVNLFFLDVHEEGPYFYLYKLFTKNEIVLRGKLQNFICITKLFIGLDLSSIWYQYGFAVPRGPTRTYLNIDTLNRFKNFVLSRLGIRYDCSRTENAIVLNRTSSRRILNIERIIKYIKGHGKRVNSSIENVDFETTKHLIKKIVNSNLLIGVHGAEMILALFMEKNSTIIEIFPYGITADVVSFLKPLQAVSQFSYLEWTNNNLSLSLRHPEYPPHKGGLEHLPVSKRKQIEALDHIEKVFCCDDPGFLHFMYQDTIINYGFHVILNQSILFNVFNSSTWYFPARIWSIECFINKTTVNLKWLPPENAASAILQYHLTLLLDSHKVELTTFDTNLILQKTVSRVSAWISARDVENGREGPDLYVSCR